MTPLAAQLNYLKQDEAISGGKAALYVTDTLIKITSSSKLEPDKLWGVKGFEAKIEICKSRHAPAGRSVNMIFDQTNGFRNDLSTLDYIKSCGALKGNGMAYYLDGGENMKFRLSNYADLFKTNETFRNLVLAQAETLMKASIKESERTELEPPVSEASESVEDSSDVK